MHSAEQLLQALTYDELYYTLQSLTIEDNYLVDYIASDLAEDFIYMLEVHDLIWIASDDRILLTNRGEKIMQYLIIFVELTKKSSKFKY